MSNIEDEIVSMKFDNRQFESGVNTTISSMDKLKSSLQFKDAGAGLSNIQQIANGVDMSNMAQNVSRVASQFNALRFAAKVAFATIVRQAVYAGERILKAITVAPIIAGFQNYETKINAIQTILANTSAEGTKLPQVTKALAQLNTYANKTVYNFSEMAKNIGTFTAAGVNLKDSVASIKGIANLAALSGSTSQQASSAMYQLSQAIAAGQVHLQDWNSVVNAGIGGAVFQKALTQTALTMGTLDKSQVHLGKTMKDTTINGNAFRQSLTPPPGGTSWLTSDVLTNTLSQFTGDLSRAQLMAEGFTKSQTTAILKQAKMAQNAATQVKTLTQLFQALKEEVASAWSNVFGTLFGNINQAKKLFSPLHQTLENLLTGPVNALNKILEGWAKLGGRVELIDGLKQGFTDIGKLLEPIRVAFGRVFGGDASKGLFSFTQGFTKLMKLLEPSQRTTRALTRIFTALFAVLKVVGQVVGGVIRYFADLIGLVGSGAPSFLLMVGNLALFIDKLVEWESKGQFIKKFFDAIILGRRAALGPLIKIISKVEYALAGLFAGHPDRFARRMGVAFSLIGTVLSVVRGAVIRFLGAFGVGTAQIQKFFNQVSQFAKNGKEIASGIIGGLISGLNTSELRAAVETFADNIVVWIKDKLGIHSPATELVPVGYNIAAGMAVGIGNGVSAIIGALGKIFGAIGNAIKYLVSGMNLSDALAVIDSGFFIALYIALKKFFGSFTGLINSVKGSFDSVGETFDQLTSNLKTMQNNVKAQIILRIAIAVGILAASIALLSTIDPKRMAAGIAAVGAMVASLLTAMMVISGGGKGKHIDTKAIAKQTAQLFALSTAMVAMAGAVLLFSASIVVLGHMKPEVLKKGLIAVASILGVLTAATAVMGKTGGGATMLAASVALGVLAGSLLVLAGALQLYANLDWQTLIQGGGSAAAVIVALGLSLRAFGKGSIGGSVALLVASGALIVLAGALQILANIGLGDMIKSVIALDFILASLAAAAAAMSAAEGGAGSMLVMAGAVIVLAKAMTMIAALSWGQIFKALGGIALAFALVAGAAILLSPVVPLIAALGGALLLLGAAMALAGLGMLSFASGLAILATIGTAGFAVIAAGVTSLLGLIPLIAEQIGLGFIAIADVIAKAGPKLLAAFEVVLAALLDAVIKLIPKIGDLIQKLVKVILRVIVNNQVNAAKAMIRFITGMLNAMADGIPKMITAGTNLILGVVSGLSKNAVRIANGIAKAVLSFLNGIDKAIQKYSGQIRNMGLKIAYDLVDGLTGGMLSYGKDKVVAAAEKLAGYIPAPIRKILNILSPSKVMHKIGGYAAEGLANGIAAGGSNVKKRSEDVAKTAMSAMQATFNNSRSAAGGLIDLTPKVTPILDLTQLERDATKIGSAMGRPSITADVSRRHARGIASDEAGRHAQADSAKGGDTFEFKQYIKSADPINHVKVYRGTKSQIALFKEVTGR